MIGERLVLLGRLARDGLEGEHDVAEQNAARRAACASRLPGREGQHVGRRVLAAVVAVKAAAAPRRRSGRRSSTISCRLAPGAAVRYSGRRGLARQCSAARTDRAAKPAQRRSHLDRRCASSDARSRLVAAAGGRALARLVGRDDARHQRVAHDVLVGEAHDADAVDAAQRRRARRPGPSACRAAGRSGSGRRSPPCASPRRGGSGTSSSAPASCSAPRRG